MQFFRAAGWFVRLRQRGCGILNAPNPSGLLLGENITAWILDRSALRWHRSVVRFIALALVLVLSGCASSEEKARRKWEAEQNAAKKAMAQKRMKSAMNTGEAGSARGAEVMVPDESKTFNPAVARFGRSATVADKSAHTGEFRFTERFRTKEYAAKDFGTKSAWLEKLNFGTKTAATKEAREASKTARSKSYETTEAREAGKIAAIPNVMDGDRKFLGKEADRMKRGIRPEDQAKFEAAWSGNLQEMSIEDVKKLLNKN